MRSRITLAVLTFALSTILLTDRLAHAQEAEIARVIGQEIVEALGKNALEFGGDEIARTTAFRLLAEATESAGQTGGRIGRIQIERILAVGKGSLIFDLKSITGKSLLLLSDVSEDGLPAALSTLTRPGVEDGIESLVSISLQKAALSAEVRLPGAGLKLVTCYGSEGAQAATKLSEDQANSLLVVARPSAINALPSIERSSLLKALARRPEALVLNLGSKNGPLLVVEGSTVIWHASDVSLPADQGVTELSDGTAELDTPSLCSGAMGHSPPVGDHLLNSLKWVYASAALGAVPIIGLLVGLRRRLSGSGMVFIGIVAASLLLQTGCKPSEKENQDARKDVASPTTPTVTLDTSQINAIILAVNKGSTADYDGKVFRLLGVVATTSCEERKGQNGTDITVELTLSNPSYAAVILSCYFAAADQDVVRKLKPGENLAVRGKFRAASSSSISFEGCIVEK